MTLSWEHDVSTNLSNYSLQSNLLCLSFIYDDTYDAIIQRNYFTAMPHYRKAGYAFVSLSYPMYVKPYIASSGEMPACTLGGRNGIIQSCSRCASVAYDANVDAQLKLV